MRGSLLHVLSGDAMNHSIAGRPDSTNKNPDPIVRGKGTHTWEIAEK